MACHGEGAGAQALTEPRRDYLARLPGGRKTPQQPAAAVRLPGSCTSKRPARTRQASWGFAGGLACRSRGTQPDSKRPLDLQRSASDLRGAWGRVAPTRHACHRDHEPWLQRSAHAHPRMVGERVEGRAPGLRSDRAPLRLAPEEAVTPPPATMAPAGPCMPTAHPTYAAASTRWAPGQTRLPGATPPPLEAWP